MSSAIRRSVIPILLGKSPGVAALTGDVFGASVWTSL
jgi:hypothetical protein